MLLLSCFALLAEAQAWISLDLSSLHWTLSSNSSGPLDQHGNIVLPGSVPGDVNADLVTAGVLPDYWIGTNALELPWWVPIRLWEYSVTFSVPPEFAHGAELRFLGCDYNCSFELNGHPLGHHYGAFVPADYEVAGLLRTDGVNQLKVAIHPPPAALISPLYNGSTPSYGVDQCLENKIFPMWKSRLNQWDFAPKTWQIGLWRAVVLRSHGYPATLQPAPVVLPRLHAPYDEAVLEVRAAWKPGQGYRTGGLRARWEVVCITDRTAPALNITTDLEPLNAATRDWHGFGTNLTLTRPRLWWPNGYGKQHRYLLTVSLLDSTTKAVVDQTTSRFGVRHLETLINEGVKEHPAWWSYNQYNDGCGPCLFNSSDYDKIAPASAGYPDKQRWMFAVNGQKIFARGGNWVPGDMFFGQLVKDQTRLRALLSMARDAGYTFMRVWGGGLVEDQHFYDLCDEFGIMLQQDFPLAGCGWTRKYPNDTDCTEGSTCSFDWLSQATEEDGLSVLSAQSEQIPLVLQQLMSHPSLVRYTAANEFYMNRSANPYEHNYEDSVRALDDTRMTREADPTCVGQRHGQYTFSLDGSGYDMYGGRWDDVGSCSSANFVDAECCGGYGQPALNLKSSGLPGCRYAGNFPGAGPTGGPGNPFEWSEFGATAISDVETLRRVDDSPGHTALLPSNVGKHQFWSRGASSAWLAQGTWAPVFCANKTLGCDASAFDSIDIIVKISQFTQAEGYRFAYQAARRVKWHRSLMASWTFDEPWPNSAHGCIVDFYGLPKHAYYWVQSALKMVDISLSYSDLWQKAGQQLQAEIWVDNEFDHPLHVFGYSIEYFTLDGAVDLKNHSSPWPMNASVNGSDHINLGRPALVVPQALVGNVLVVRLTLWSSPAATLALATNDYHFAIVKESAPVASNTQQVGPLRPMLLLQTVQLKLAQVGGTKFTVALHAAAANHQASALFVKPMLIDVNDRQVPYVAFSQGFVTIRPGSSEEFELLQPGAGNVEPTLFCAEAWNVLRTCIKLEIAVDVYV